MAMVYKYVAWDAGFTVDLGTDAIRLGSIAGFSERAEHMGVGNSAVDIDDPDADVGHAGDAILGLQLFTVDETACPAGNQRLYTGYIGTREYGRASARSLITGASRGINVALYDLNCVAGFRAIPQSDTDAKRPAETVGERLTWILGSDYLDGLLADNGLVVYPSDIGMDAADYRGQRPSNVINDCELASGYFAFVYPDETETVIASLFFDDANTSTAYSTTLRITNDKSLVDNTTTFLGEVDFKLRRSPDDVGSGVLLPYAKGMVYETRAATEDTYGVRDLIAPNSNVKTSAKASLIAQEFLWDHHTENDRLVGTVKLPKAHVNDLRAGHRLEVKFSNLPGYTSFTWVRCLARAPGQVEETDEFYTVSVELSPQEEDPPVGQIIQQNFGRGGEAGCTLALPNPVTVDDILVVLVSDRSNQTPIAPWTGAVDHPALGGTGAWTHLDGTTATGSSPTSHGITAFWKVASDDENTAYVAASRVSLGIWQLRDVDMSSVELLVVDQGTGAPPYDAGTFATFDAGDIAILGVIMTTTPSSHERNPLPIVDTGDWTQRWWKGSYTSGLPGGTGEWDPLVWYGDALGAGAAIDAEINATLTTVHPYFAIVAMRIPPV